MKVLVDTHALLWLFDGDSRLSERARSIFLDPGNQLFFSIASLWELCVKLSLEKLVLDRGWFDTLTSEMLANQVSWLAIEAPHCRAVESLDFHHRDPFDRMLIAQAMVENMSVMTRDPHFRQYPVDCVW